MVPCAQGRVIVETTRAAPPHFATCSTYRRPITNASNTPVRNGGNLTAHYEGHDQGTSRGAISKNAPGPQSPALRPDDLSVTPWYREDYPESISPGPGDRSSYPSHLYCDDREGSRPDLNSMRNSSIESDAPRLTNAPRKACMDLQDAIALLNETCPNPEPSPSLTPRTPRTPLTPHPRNKRTRSKSSDNSSNYSNDRLSDRSFETSKSAREREKKRPFLRKIGISKTEDRPLFAKFAPKIVGKPYLEKIGPSKAVEKPFLDKIGSSRTLDKFTFETPRNDRSVLQVHPLREESQMVQTTERRRSGKNFLRKMHSFETEDLEEANPMKAHRDPLRGASLDDVLDSGPSSLPPIEDLESPMTLELEPKAISVAELVKCKVTTSEEIESSATSLASLRDQPNSSGNSPRRRRRTKRASVTKSSDFDSKEGLKSDESTPNSPTKRSISTFAKLDIQELEFSPSKTRRQTSEESLDSRIRGKGVVFERQGRSADGLEISQDQIKVTVTSESSIFNNDRNHKQETGSSQDSLITRDVGKDYSRETFKQLQGKFQSQEIPMESYAEFKRRTRANFRSIAERHRAVMRVGAVKQTVDILDTSTLDTKQTPSGSTETKESEGSQGATIRSVLRKQDGIDQASDQECDGAGTLLRPKRRIFHEPSQETMDLLTELRKVKSLLRTPSIEKENDGDTKPVRFPKKILLTDKEFCLSVERENSIRRPSRTPNSEDAENPNSLQIPDSGLLDKRCLSLEYADEEKSQRTDVRAASPTSAKGPLSETEDTVDSSELALMCDSKSYSSDVFNTPSDENVETIRDKSFNADSKMEDMNHYLEVDIAIPIDQKHSPKRRVQIQGRTSDLYEIISPRSTPFRVKKRLDRISVEETVKQESFTLNKVDCRSVVTQKRTKCFPL